MPARIADAQSMEAIRKRIEARSNLLSLHLDMLIEADGRGEAVDLAQLELIYSEMEFLAGLMRTIAAGRIALELSVSR